MHYVLCIHLKVVSVGDNAAVSAALRANVEFHMTQRPDGLANASSKPPSAFRTASEPNVCGAAAPNSRAANGLSSHVTQLAPSASRSPEKLVCLVQKRPCTKNLRLPLW